MMLISFSVVRHFKRVDRKCWNAEYYNKPECYPLYYLNFKTGMDGTYYPQEKYSAEVNDITTEGNS